MLELAQIIDSNAYNNLLIFDIEVSNGNIQVRLDINDMDKFKHSLNSICIVTGQDFATDTKKLHHIPFMLERGLDGIIDLYKIDTEGEKPS